LQVIVIICATLHTRNDVVNAVTFIAALLAYPTISIDDALPYLAPSMGASILC
jgi:hypothetical protein